MDPAPAVDHGADLLDARGLLCAITRTDIAHASDRESEKSRKLFILLLESCKLYADKMLLANGDGTRVSAKSPGKVFVVRENDSLPSPTRPQRSRYCSRQYVRVIPGSHPLIARFPSHGFTLNAVRRV